MAVLDFEPEFLECIARIGVAKYRSVKGMTPVQGIKGFIQNLIGEMDEEAVVALATYIRAERYDFATLAKPLAGQNAAAHAKWIDCWSRVECMDMEGFPLWEEELHNLMQPLFGELSTIFLAYCRSISEDSAADAMEMSMDEFHDFVVDVGLETKKYKFDVMCNQFIKAHDGTRLEQRRFTHTQPAPQLSPRPSLHRRTRRTPRRRTRSVCRRRPRTASPTPTSRSSAKR